MPTSAWSPEFARPGASTPVRGHASPRMGPTPGRLTFSGAALVRPRRLVLRTRVVSLLSLALFLLSFLAGTGTIVAQATPMALTCPATPVADAGTTYPLAIADDAGREVTIAAAPERIISIAPSNTEILFALGLGENVVAVDTYSNYPLEATEKPQVGDYVDPNLEAIVAAEPDLILAGEAHVASVLPDLEALGLPTVVIEPVNLDEALASMTLIGEIADKQAAAANLVCSLQGRIDAVTTAIAGAPRPRVFFELSPDLYTAGPGSFIDDLLVRAGGANIAAGAGEIWPQMSAEALITADPEVIIVTGHEAGVTTEDVANRPGWQDVSAVANDRLEIIDADLVARPGPRVVDALEAVAAALHPDCFPVPAS
jgi:iron complex transport system substrate-binding protein